MQLADDVEAIAIDEEPEEYFVYHEWMEEGDIPRDVTHVRVDSSVRAIKNCAFFFCTGLTVVIFNKELEEIESEAFSQCWSLEEIDIPNAVKKIEDCAFMTCQDLTAVTLGHGLEEIGAYAFEECTTLREIVIPNAVRAIRGVAFNGCTGLTTVTLGNGLKEIGAYAFNDCISLQHIYIPPAVKRIHDTAFKGCSNLTSVKFCDKIERFVTCEAMLDWWNQGLHEKSLSTYCFLVRCNIPERLSGLAKIGSWQANIFDMLRIIPTISAAANDEDNEDSNDEVDNDEGDEVDDNDGDNNADDNEGIIANADKEDEEDEEDVKDEDEVNNNDNGDVVVDDNSNDTDADNEGINAAADDEDADEYDRSNDDDNDGEDNNDSGSNMLNAYFETIDAKLTVYENLLNEAHVLFPDQFGLFDGIVLNILSFL
jgi:hypothetical protein